MCFYVECDWTASVYVSELRTAEKPLKCDECRIEIPVGEQYRYVFGQENEECRCLEDDEYYESTLSSEALLARYALFDVGENPPDHDVCTCEKPDYGDEFEYRRCLECDQFLEAVARAEHAAGCDVDESRPGLFDMLEAIAELGEEESAKYFTVADEMYPGLRRTGYLQRIKAQVS